MEEAELTGRECIGGDDQVLVDEGSGSRTPCLRLLELPHRYLTNNLSPSFLLFDILTCSRRHRCPAVDCDSCLAVETAVPPSLLRPGGSSDRGEGSGIDICC